MKKMTSEQIRQLFVDYFIDKGHTYKASAPIVPRDDKTLLFVNAGMVPFKNIFLGREVVEFDSATSAQLCIRAGGKHNDLENVGYTLRHHTLFEMLGNFSFGRYFKKQAIEYAWHFLTQVLAIPEKKLWVTVYHDDLEAAEIWHQGIGLAKERIIPCGDADNFWSMGDTGPCGPCSEIFYDHGPEIAGGPPGSADEDGDRFVEIWNLVFMQYNRTLNGECEPLKTPCVDTGMGLERMAAVMQGVNDNYETDIFQNLLHHLKSVLGKKDIRAPEVRVGMRVIADHIRSAAFLIAEGVTPSNEGRGYVLRHIIRRALRFGFKMQQDKPFFYKMVDPLVSAMGMAYPQLEHNKVHIQQVLKHEEVHFAETLSHGLKLLENELQQLEGQELAGDVVFKLYDTYGFPADLTADIAKENHVSIDLAGFNKELERQRQQSKKHSKFHVDYTHQLYVTVETEFVGYKHLQAEGAVLQLLHNEQPVNELRQEQVGVVVLDKTPFYAEGGGQVGDRGFLKGRNGSFQVLNTTKMGKTYLHHGHMKQGILQIGESLQAEVRGRQSIACNHTATHMLHAALRQLLGPHVQQKGSLVAADRLRFDFTHTSALSDAQLCEIEQLVNQQIRLNLSVETTLKDLEEARAAGALALFDEKYSQKVRVLRVGEFSHEVCGGTHVAATGEIGSFKILSGAAIASGIRRIEAVTGQQALACAQYNQHQLQEIAGLLKIDCSGIQQRLMQLLKQQQEQNQQKQQLQRHLMLLQSQKILQDGEEIEETFVLASSIKRVDKQGLLFLIDQIKSKYPRHAVILATEVEAKKIMLVAAVSQEVSLILPAAELLRQVTGPINGHGGGRPTLAQGGGTESDKLVPALAAVPDWVRQQLTK